MILSTRFALQVDCGAAPAATIAEIAVSISGINPSYSITVDGVKLSPGRSPIMLPCGSKTEHTLELEVPKERPGGAIGGTISFAATSGF